MFYNVYIKERGRKKGVLRINKKGFDTIEEAEAFANTLEDHLFSIEIIDTRNGKVVKEI